MKGLFPSSCCSGIMVYMDVLTDALGSTSNAEKHGKHQLCSRIIVWFLPMTMKHGYLGESEITDDHRAGKNIVNLTHRLNKGGVISPRFNVQPKGLEKPAAFTSLWIHCDDRISWIMRKQSKSTQRENPGFLFLNL